MLRKLLLLTVAVASLSAATLASNGGWHGGWGCLRLARFRRKYEITRRAFQLPFFERRHHHWSFAKAA